MSGRVPRCRQNRHALSDLEVAINEPALRDRRKRACRVGVEPVALDLIYLEPLYEEGHIRAIQKRILAAVIEVQVAVDHADHRRSIDSDGAQGFVEPRTLGLVHLVDEGIAEPDPGVEHDRAVRMNDDVSINAMGCFVASGRQSGSAITARSNRRIRGNDFNITRSLTQANRLRVGRTRPCETAPRKSWSAARSKCR